MFPDSLGPGEYLPMFGGFHIEIILLEIHGKIIAGSGLAQFLDRAKVSITGVRNVVVNDPKLLVLDTCFKCVCVLNTKR